jgi:8-oxo-dGTP diphosphatase
MNNNERKSKPANRSKVRIEHSTGGVVFRRTPRGVLIGFIKDSVGKWTFPKGRLMRGERVEAAALRETREEMGLRQVRIVVPLGTTSIWFKDRFEHVGEMVHKYITYFLVEAAPGEHGRPQGRLHGHGELITAIRWVPYRNTARTVSYKNMLPIVRKAVAYLDGQRTK